MWPRADDDVLLEPGDPDETNLVTVATGRGAEGPAWSSWSWTEDTSACQDPESAARTVADGTFSFTLDPGSETFTGYWETTGFPEPNEWNGTRIG